MINYFFCLIIVFSLIFGIVMGNISEVSNSAIQGGTDAIQLFLILVGTLALWGGIMRIAEKSGITKVICKALTPLAKLLFKGLDTNGAAFRAITLNITANLMGLGNASTPLGLDAMKKLEKEEGKNPVASRNMIMLVILNTASIQLIPTTIASLRLEYGSRTPMDILPAVLTTSLISVVVGIIMVFTLDLFNKGGNKE